MRVKWGNVVSEARCVNSVVIQAIILIIIIIIIYLS